MDSIFSVMYVCIYLGAQSRTAAVSGMLVQAPRNANVFSAVSISFHTALLLACKTCVNDNNSDEQSLFEKSADAESVVSALCLMVYSPFLPRHPGPRAHEVRGSCNGCS